MPAKFMYHVTEHRCFIGPIKTAGVKRCVYFFFFFLFFTANCFFHKFWTVVEFCEFCEFCELLLQFELRKKIIWEYLSLRAWSSHSWRVIFHIFLTCFLYIHVLSNNKCFVRFSKTFSTRSCGLPLTVTSFLYFPYFSAKFDGKRHTKVRVIKEKPSWKS